MAQKTDKGTANDRPREARFEWSCNVRWAFIISPWSGVRTIAVLDGPLDREAMRIRR